MKMRSNYKYYLYIFGLLVLHSCVYHKGDEISPAQNCTKILPDTVSYSKDVQVIFTMQCATSGCHAGSSPTGNLNLDAAHSYSQLTKSGSGYINTANPTSSLLYSSLVSVSDPMPPTGKLSDCDIALIEKWMQQKAKNN